jgi:hypothetical protein
MWQSRLKSQQASLSCYFHRPPADVTAEIRVCDYIRINKFLIHKIVLYNGSNIDGAPSIVPKNSLIQSDT